MDNNTKAFFALLRAGLWEKDVRLLSFGDIDYSKILSLAEEQSVVGLVAAGLEHVRDLKVPKMDVLQFAGQALVLERQNTAMNKFLGELVDKMRAEGIYTILVKGQGIAQCYDRPLWRACGDVDFFLNEENYNKAKAFLMPLASSIEIEGDYSKHQGLTIDSWEVELHGSMRCGLSKRIDTGINESQRKVFDEGSVRVWMNGETQVFLPGVDEDVIFVFTHFLKHFYKEGLGLRQVCDWCRLLWIYKDSLNHRLLKSRIQQMRLMSEWKAFGSFAVEYLGMPVEAMPLFNENDNHNDRLKRKAARICEFIMEVGNMGHNRDSSYFRRYPYLIRKVLSFKRRSGDLLRHARIFPLDSVRFFPSIVFLGLRSAVKGG